MRIEDKMLGKDSEGRAMSKRFAKYETIMRNTGFLLRTICRRGGVPRPLCINNPEGGLKLTWEHDQGHARLLVCQNAICCEHGKPSPGIEFSEQWGLPNDGPTFGVLDFDAIMEWLRSFTGLRTP